MVSNWNDFIIWFMLVDDFGFDAFYGMDGFTKIYSRDFSHSKLYSVPCGSHETKHFKEKSNNIS